MSLDDVTACRKRGRETVLSWMCRLARESAETWPRATYLVLPFALALYLILKTSTEALLFSFLGFNYLRVNSRFLKTEVLADATQEHHGGPPSLVTIPRLQPSPLLTLSPEANHSHTPRSRFCPQTQWKNPDAGKD